MLLRRAAAFVYDSLLMLAAFFVVTGASVYLNGMESVGGVGFAALLWVVGGAFLVLFWRNGRTLGMQAWRLRIVPGQASGNRASGGDGADTDGAIDGAIEAAMPAPGVGALVLRYALGSALFAITWAWMLFDRDGLALHDRLSRTRIVRGRG